MKPILFFALFFSLSTTAHAVAHKNTRSAALKPKPDKVEKNKNPFDLPAHLTGSFTFSTNYLFRGVSQSNNHPVAQGNLVYTLPNTGLYAYVWGANVDFFDMLNQKARVEVDTGIGFNSTDEGNFQYNLMFLRYIYPAATGVSYNEFVANARFFFVTGLLGYSSSVFGTGEAGTYYNLGLNADLPPKYAMGLSDVNLTATVGYYALSNFSDFNGSYMDYLIQLTKTIKNYHLSLSWSSTNLDDLPLRRLSRNKVLLTFVIEFS